MLKKIYLVIFCVTLLSIGNLGAEIVPGSELIFRITSPEMLTGGSSACGGGLFSAGPSSISVNPALPAGEQRVMLNLGYTILLQSKDEMSVGNAGQLALLIPSRWGVFSVVAEGAFCDLDPIKLDNVLTLRAGFAKDINEELYAGAAISGGVRWGKETDWALALNLGFVYHWGNLGFLQDVRIAGALMNLGKPYVSGLPAIGSPKVGIAGTLFTVAGGKLVGGFSADISAPQLLNIVFDAGLQLQIAEIITIKSAWQFNMKEQLEGHKNLMPSVGLVFKFGIDSKDNQFLKEKGWQQSEVTASGAWQKLYDEIHAASAGISINLGLKDIEAPEIILWGE
ncbi:MAG: hypothetical protein J6B81_04160 [Spirochaetaceae bacterium]|nr:hypothetical protein [Spirochaetaceae bacterium]